MRAKLWATVPLIPAIATLVPATASADQWDYVSSLDNNGVYYTNVNDVIDTGKFVCRELRTSHDPNRALMATKLSGYPQKDARIIVISAAGYMCRDEFETVRNWANPPAAPGT